LRYRVVFGRTLTLELAVRNTGTTPFTLQEALHTYFAVGDIREVAIDGLAGVRYLDKVHGGERRVQGSEPVRFSGETDRPYLDTEAAVTIVDPRARPAHRRRQARLAHDGDMESMDRQGEGDARFRRRRVAVDGVCRDRERPRQCDHAASG
jgi:D-hexose-6-phosphate mutarotase